MYISWLILWMVCNFLFSYEEINIWAASWEIQQHGMCAQWRLWSDWASSEDSDQPGHPLSLIRVWSDWASSEDSDQPGRMPRLIWVFAVRMKKAWVLSYPLNAQHRLWSDWTDAQADLSLCWAHSHLVGFVMRQLRTCDLYRSRQDLPILGPKIRLPPYRPKLLIYMNSDFSLLTKAKTCFPIIADACFI